MRSRQYQSIYISTHVDLDEVLSEISNEIIREEYQRRYPIGTPVERDLLKELHWNLMRGDIQSALALIDAELAAQKITDDKRLAQFLAARATVNP